MPFKHQNLKRKGYEKKKIFLEMAEYSSLNSGENNSF